MSNVEGITTADILKQHGYEDRTLERHLLNYWIKKCRKDAKAHTNQTLQEMKEKVESYDEGNPLMPNDFLSKETVLQLIDEAINE